MTDSAPRPELTDAEQIDKLTAAQKEARLVMRAMAAGLTAAAEELGR